MIPFVNLSSQRNAYREELEIATQRVYDSGCFIGGKEIEALEAELSTYSGATQAITCASGTGALLLSLLALDIREGDEVIVPDFTFVAPAECVALLGAIPRFADISKDTFLIDPAAVEALITPKTRGIIAVDLFGQCANYEVLQNVANTHNLWIIEDAAQSFGASHFGKKSGNLTRIAATSFYPSKPFGCYGDGGAVFTSDEKLASRVRALANHGSTEHYVHESLGTNSRLDALQAAILRVKLRHLENELMIRRQNAEIYNAFFANFKNVRTPTIAAGNTSTFAQYTLVTEDRTLWEKKFAKAEIPTCIHYPQPLHTQPCFARLGSHKVSTPQTEEICGKVLSLPVCAFTDVKAILNRIS